MSVVNRTPQAQYAFDHGYLAEQRHEGYSRCPADVIKAISDYEANVKSGAIAFNDSRSIMATDYPGEAQSDSTLAEYVTDHVDDESDDDGLVWDASQRKYVYR